ncbi:hypothetical protein QBC35DRAFT_428916 [Podospora australis]|uniref:Glucan 1, 4-alpha-glucosidase n=1 Tax=Podospora australis TaxID=1536484 RepID=A0AAN6WXQ4_9PEZI|nr:hypothetical protein QBC35DRAFT_428916 [Podospora australis]
MSTSPQSPPKRPRLSLQIKAIANGPSVRNSRIVAAAVDVKSATAFNTLSNVYATAVDRSTPIQEKAPVSLLTSDSNRPRPILRLQTQTQDALAKARPTHTPYLGPYLDTPITAQPLSPAVAMEVRFPSAMTATPPLSAQAQDNGARVFTFDTKNNNAFPSTQGSRTPGPSQNGNPKRRTTMPAGMTKLPYTHPRSLRSILRNSPLPPLSTRSPDSPRRQSLRLQEKAARRVAYNSPLEQTITTSWYVKSHIDLLAEDATPVSPSVTSESDTDSVLDQTMAYSSSNETRDGGQTPGPFEEMRRRMANMNASSPISLSPTSSGGIRKKGGKRREKKRRWVWTIGQDEDGEESGSALPGTPGGVAVPVVDAPVRKEPTTAAVQQLHTAAVPVIAMPAPRPRTRGQTAMAKSGSAQVPLLAVPSPRTRSSGPPSPPSQPAPVTALSAQELHQLQQQQARDMTPVASTLPHFNGGYHSSPGSGYASSCSRSSSLRLSMTPEPSLPSEYLNMNMNMNIEPPTPSVESTQSQDSEASMFDHHHHAGGGADVEMSDASSFMSDDLDLKAVAALSSAGPKLSMNFDLGGIDAVMDDGTPTLTARPVGAPWRDGSGLIC